MASNRLQLNHAKTEVLCTSSRRQHQIPSGPVRIGSTDVQPVSSTRDLGVYIDADMSMRTHVTAVIRACFAALRQIRSVRRSLSRHALLTLVRALDCQQGGLLQLGSRWHLWPAARPVAVRLEYIQLYSPNGSNIKKCRRPFGFLSEAVKTHNPIASRAPLVASSGANYVPAVRSGLPLSSWNSAGVPCWEPPDI